LLDGINRKLEIGRYANKEMAFGAHALPTGYRNLTDRRSILNIFSAVPTDNAGWEAAVEHYRTIAGRTQTGVRSRSAWFIEDLADLVHNKEVQDIIGSKDAGLRKAITDEAEAARYLRELSVSQTGKASNLVATRVGWLARELNADVGAGVVSSGHRGLNQGQLVRSASLFAGIENRADKAEIFDQLLSLNSLDRRAKDSLRVAKFDAMLEDSLQQRLLDLRGDFTPQNMQRQAFEAHRTIKEAMIDSNISGSLHRMTKDRSVSLAFENSSTAMDFLSDEYRRGRPGLASVLLEDRGATRTVMDWINPTASEQLTRTGLTSRMFLERFTNILGLRSDNVSSNAALFGKVFTHRILPMAGAIYGLRALDTFTDANPLFAGTMLDEGIFVAAGEQVAKTHLLSSRVLDASGLTHASKWAEGLMPGFINSPMARFTRTVGMPLAGYGLGMKYGGLHSAKTGLIAGLALDATLGFGLTDLTKTHGELVDEYAGRTEVPVKKGRWWEFGKTPYEGTQIQYFRPNWFARLKSQHQYTPEGFGTKWESLLFQPIPFIDAAPGMLIEPDWYARKNYLTRPYPVTSNPFSEAAIVGPLAGATIGSVLNPPSVMHGRELESALTNPGSNANMFGGTGLGTSGNYMAGTPQGAQISGPSDWQQTLSRQFYYGITEPGGLFGWAASNLAGGQMPLAKPNELASATAAQSQIKRFWDLNLGGFGLLSEPIRRLLPRELAAINKINPIMNTMADWLPENMQRGDQFASMPEGSLRLPGTGYETMRAVTHAFPSRESQLGKSMSEIVQGMLGMPQSMSEEQEEIMSGGTEIHRQIQEELTRQNLAVAIEQNIYDPYHDISGTADLILRYGREQAVGEIKTKSLEAMQKLSGPQQSHMSQLNFYLHTTKMRRGFLIYAAREDPSVRKVYEFNYSRNMFERDMAKVEQARAAAADLLTTVPTTHGASYSHADRLKILADVAPTSDQYYRELMMTTKQSKMGLMSPEEQYTYETALKQRNSQMRGMDLYPNRFLGKMMSPEATYNLQSENTNIKAASEYNIAERAMGAAWEGLQAVPNPLSTKFFNYQTPEQAYQRAQMYGNLEQSWDHPVRSFVTPYGQRFLGSSNPVSGAWRGGMAGFLMGGPAGAALLGSMGAMYGGGYSAVKATTGWSYLPSEVKKERALNQTFDRLAFAKGMVDNQMTGSPESFEMAQNTYTAWNTGRSSSMANFMRATPHQERQFMGAFINTTDPAERNRILKMLPTPAAEGLERVWNNQEGASFASHSGAEDYVASQGMMNQARNWQAFTPQTMQATKVKMIKNEGLKVQDFGLGYASQLYGVQNNPNVPDSMNLSDPLGVGAAPSVQFDSVQIKRQIEQMLINRGARSIQVSVNEVSGVEARGTLTINCRQDRTQDMLSVLRSTSND
jgi:hypothetical protein